VRTTVHSELLNEKDIREMIAYLENTGYTGNYYIQHFMNDVKTIEKLDYSSKKLEDKNLSTAKIKVHFRG